MMSGKADFYQSLMTTLDGIRADGFFKSERRIAGHQQASIRLDNGAKVLNFCANNYLGLADDSRLIAAGADVLVAGTATFTGGPGAYAANITRLRG